VRCRIAAIFFGYRPSHTCASISVSIRWRFFAMAQSCGARAVAPLSLSLS
jgi:hypothetical protein